MLVDGFHDLSTGGANVLVGHQWEFLRRRSRVSVGVSSRAPLASSSLWSFQIQDRRIVVDAVIFVRGRLVTGGVQDTLVSYPDDFGVIDEPGEAGERLILRLDGTAGVISWVVMITEVA